MTRDRDSAPPRGETGPANAALADGVVRSSPSEMPLKAGDDTRRSYGWGEPNGSGRGGSFGAFLRSRRGGAMLIGSLFGTMALFTAGTAMVNHAWREAQSEELQAVLRAAVSSTGALLVGSADDDIRAQIRQRIAGFAEGAMPGLKIDEDDVKVGYDPATRETRISFGGGKFTYTDLLGPGSPSDLALALPTNEIRVILEAYRYEVAVALDVSTSMQAPIRDRSKSKLDALKDAARAVSDAMKSAAEATTGRMAVSMVPFSNAVKVADTSGSIRTPGKERYLRMLAGMPAAGEGIDATLRAARTQRAEGWGHWVDSFHHYGVGADLGALRRRNLPDGLLDSNDWDLRRTRVEVDVSAQAPMLDTGGTIGRWVVDDEDFWNGCVMARWGAYWDDDARPPGWSASDADHWPYRKEVPAWSPRGFALAASATPLHLSDAPPDADDPNTLFTAYSWPDARIGGHADHRLQTVMATLLAAPDAPGLGRSGQHSLEQLPTSADNDWSATGSPGGKGLCPDAAIRPLGDDIDGFEDATGRLAIGCALFPDCLSHTNPDSMTYLAVGIVWSLRTLSPLWQRVWQTKDQQGTALPVASCAEGDSHNDCDPNTRKSILIISDGTNDFGDLRDGTLTLPRGSLNAEWSSHGVHCTPRRALHASFRPYHDAAEEDTPQAFNARFRDYLDGGTFGGARLGDVVDAFRAFDRFANVTPAQQDARRAVLETLTPWQLFRRPEAGVTDSLMDETNAFGFDHRPVQTGHFCRPTSLFGPYGRIGDTVYVGDSGSPVPNVAPFGIPASLTRAQYREWLNNGHRRSQLSTTMRRHLDDWFLNACKIAGKRGVRINAIYIRGVFGRWQQDIQLLEQCVDAAGGDPAEDDVYVAYDSDSLEEAFERVFDIRVRNLRFLD